MQICHFRKKGDDDKYEGTTWQIKFNLDNVNQAGTYKLRVALATAYVAELQVRVNNPKANPPLFTTGVIGHDNTITRHGIHGLYRLYSIDVKGALLMEGENTIYLTQPMCSSPVQGLVYDYIRLEAPPSNNSTKIVWPFFKKKNVYLNKVILYVNIILLPLKFVCFISFRSFNLVNLILILIKYAQIYLNYNHSTNEKTSHLLSFNKDKDTCVRKANFLY